MVINIIGLVIWLIFSIIHFIKPKERSAPNWFVGMLGILIVLDYLVEILKSLE
jgi:uncharacterized membrane protein YbhN (UPF0104 family)